MSIVQVTDLRVHFHTRNGLVRAVDGVSMPLSAGETVGIVGESGSGKSVLFLSLLGLIPMPPGRIESGSVLFEGKDLLELPPAALRSVRGREIGMIFQDPMTALNPYMTVGEQVMEPLLVHGRISRREAREQAIAILHEVGIPDAERRMSAYPHAFSGGMRQRIMIAMTLAPKPKVLIADEPTTALDVTVQAQILDLMARLQQKQAMATVIITHDLGVVARACRRVMVMYAGRIVETAPVEELFDHPRHPYTAALMASMPVLAEPGKALPVIPGRPPEQGAPAVGCAFAPRCAHAVDACRKADCRLREMAPGHESACLQAREGRWP